MSFKVEYASRRREVWAWYWRAWRERLWKTHLVVFLAVTAMASLYAKGSGALLPASVAIGLALGITAIICIQIYPHLMFKSQKRTLRTDEEGILTTIKNRSSLRL